jgi:hypothetical protein
MIPLHRFRVALTVLAAMLVVGFAVPSVDARLPRARPYHPGGRITLDTNLLSKSGVSAWAIDEYLEAATPLPPLGAAFVHAEQKYGINARFLLAAAVHESGWGKGYIARAKHNLFGYNAYDRDPLRFASAYGTFAANIDDTARFIKDAYLTRTGRWWGGQPTLRSMQQFWSSSHTWGINVSRIVTSIHLARLSGRKISFAAPIVSGPLHPGERASVHLGWVGSSIPTGVEFTATWKLIAPSSEVMTTGTSPVVTGDPGPIGATAPSAAPARPSPGAAVSVRADPVRSTIVAARRVGTAARRIALVVAAPVAPGRYLLDVEMRDSDGRLLPAAERVHIPSVEVRVWGDRAVSYDLEPNPAGDGAVVRITNTGRTTIPAISPRISPVSHHPDAQVARSFLTVTASATAPAMTAPRLLITAPLVADLLPGATVSLDVPGIEALTGRTTNWLSVDLIVLGEATWLGAYSPVDAWFFDARSAPQSQPGRSNQPD